MVARAWPVSVEVIRIGCLLLRVKRAHPHVSMTLLSWDIPLISFNGSLWDVLLRCSKWLMERGLIASQWSWDADWSSESNEPAPLSLWHCDPELCSIEKRFLWYRTAHFMGRSYTIESQWGNFGTLLAPQGCNFYPILRYGLTEPASLFKCGKFHILWNPLSELRGVKVFRNVKSMRFFGLLFRPWGEHRTPDRL